MNILYQLEQWIERNIERDDQGLVIIDYPELKAEIERLKALPRPYGELSIINNY